MVLGVQSIQQERVRFKTTSAQSHSSRQSQAAPSHSDPSRVLEPPEQREGDAGMAEGLEDPTVFGAEAARNEEGGGL